MVRRTPLAVCAALLLATGAAATATASPHPAARSGTPDPSQYTHGKVTNRWVPLKPGTRMVYSGIKDGERSTDVVYVTRRTVTVQGVVCRVVADRLYLHGRLEEKTYDWYAQHRNGDVWYFGENTAEYDAQGHVTNREGTWKAGRDGARAGIYITAHPTVGQTALQEYYKGHAEDHFKVIDTAAAATVPMLWTHNAVETKEWTPLEPGVVDHKFYVRDIGTVLETTAKGPREVNRLVSVSHVQ